MKIIIFDVDGVLECEDTLIAERNKYQLKKVAEKHNVTLSEAKNLFDKARLSLPKEKSKTTVYVIEKLGFTRKEYFDMINAVDPEGLIKPYPGCPEILSELSKKYVLVAFSNTPREALDNTLKILKAKSYFKKIYTSEDFNESKPSPKIIAHILKDQKISANEAMSIGNSYEKDIVPSKNAGTKTILFDPDKKWDKKPSEADFIVRSLKEIQRIV